MYAERCGDISRGGYMSYREQNGEAGDAGNAADRAECPRSSTDPTPLLGHCCAQQQRKGWIAWHRVILLRCRKGEKNQNKPDPAERQQSNSPRPVNGFETQPADSGKIHAPGESPDQMKKQNP